MSSLNGDASRETLRAGRSLSVEGGPIAPPSGPIAVDFTKRRASLSPLTISGAILASGRSRWLRTVIMVSTAFYNIRSPLTRLARKSVIAAVKPYPSTLPSIATRTSRNWVKRELVSAKISHALSQSRTNLRASPTPITKRSVATAASRPSPPIEKCNRQAVTERE